MPNDVVSRRPLRARRGRSGALAVVLALAALVVPLVAAPVATAETAPGSPAPSGDRPLWVLPESGNMLAAFNRTEYNEQDGTPQQVASPDAPARQALQFTLEGGDTRTEVEPRVPQEREGDVQYYTYVAKLADDFPTDANTWQLLLQWHHQGDSGSPPVALQARGNRLMLAAEGEDLQDLGPLRGGDRIEVTMRIAFSRDPSRGAVDVWRGADHVLSAYRPEGGTLLDEANYMKVGLYRDDGIDEDGRLWLEDLRIGPTLASVRSPATASTAAPVEDETTAAPGSSSSSSGSLTWAAGALLVLVGGAAVLAMTRRRARR
ncbi:heparin lyase I family protein [Actinomycetospora lemnae]|uniref:Heparin lyase I family protein n=1 Tax=Actinomycetospora lemnae TaxID=3019891 RepID=A0ABT5SV19_9PSEU|nr:heparin lyase I family protein [Actinomycetospora sp. DW7H6]MDD7966703.1 heparin lyase I family protein [Actinomycetospora sp. DW7H6]